MFSATEPFSGIRADLCIDVLVRLERMLNAGLDSMIVTLPRALVISVTMFDDRGPDRLYAYAYARLVLQLTYGLHHICS